MQVMDNRTQSIVCFICFIFLEFRCLNIAPILINRSTFLSILVWPKSSFRFFHNILQKNPNELFGQPNIKKRTLTTYFFPGTVLSTAYTEINSIISTFKKHPKHPKQLVCLLPIFPVINPGRWLNSIEGKRSLACSYASSW